MSKKLANSKYCGGCGAELIPVKVRRLWFNSQTGKRDFETYWSCPKSVTAVGRWQRFKYTVRHPLDSFVPHEDPKSWESYGY